MSEPKFNTVTPRPLARLEAIPHSPATNEELSAYARGIIEGIAKYPTPNCVGSILARVRQDNAAIEQLRAALKRIVDDLPANRDWLDPDVERIARELITPKEEE